MRKLASIRVANNLFPIEGADAIEAVQVDGWVCVSKKGEFQAGDKGIYFEIDSFLPSSDSRFSFLEKQFVSFEGNRGARLRTIRLRGQRSQGLFLPLDKFPELQGKEVGDDVTEMLGVVKWEAPVPAQLAGEVEGGFPNYINQTDQNRCISGDTVIKTDDVENPFKTIQDIVRLQFAGKVKSFNHETGAVEFKNVVGWSEMPNENDWLEITLKSGKIVYVTPNHKIWSNDRNGYFEAETFKTGEKLVSM